MPRYLARVYATIQIDAENAAQAHALAKRLRVIPGDVVGSSRGQHERDGVSYRIKKRAQTIRIQRMGGP